MTNGYMLIIGLDSNQSVKSSRRRTYEMQNFIDKFSLKTILENNTDPTFHHYNGSESQIDHIYHNLENKDTCYKISFNKILCKHEFHENISSHDAIIGDFYLSEIMNKDNEELTYLSSYTKFDVSKICWNLIDILKYQNLCKQKI